jgi:hypothetical protein
MFSDLMNFSEKLTLTVLLLQICGPPFPTHQVRFSSSKKYFYNEDLVEHLHGTV